MEDKELYNPQNGEVIKAKRPKQFWKDWKFYVYSLIALLLALVSVSSMVTACAAINAGVGAEKEDASSFVAPKGLRHDGADTSLYGTTSYCIYNYSGVPFDLHVYVGTERRDRSISAAPASLYSAGAAISQIEITFSEVLCNGLYDVWADGSFYNSVNVTAGNYSTVNILGENNVTDSLSSYSYFWLFEHTPSSNDWNGVFTNDVPVYGYCGTDNNTVYNYSSINLVVEGHTDGQPPLNADLYRGNPMVDEVVDGSSVYCYSHASYSFTSMVEYPTSYKGKVFVDVFIDGEYFGVAPVWYNPNSDAPTTYYFDMVVSTHYVWLFDHDAYADGFAAGYTEGVGTSKGFVSVTCAEAGETPANFEQYSSYANVYKMIEFVDGVGDDYSIYVMPFNLEQASPTRFRVIVWKGTEYDEDAVYTNVLATIGYLDLSNGFYYVSSNTIYEVNDGVIGNVFNDSLSRQLLKFVSSDVNPYTVGYETGKAEGYATGYKLGKVDGINSAQPDSLTTTLVTVFQQPFNQIYRFFNFNILGLNVLALVTGLLTLFIVLKVLKKVRK